MKLPISKIFNKKEKSEYYLALLLHDERTTGVIIEEQQGKVTIVGRGEEYFSTSIETVSMEELLDKIDRTISRAEEKLPANVETQKTIFGVKDTWIEEKKIKKEFLVKLKAVCDELNLIPTGFLVIPEALAHLLQEEEGAPVSAILTEIAKNSVTVSLLRAGRILETKTAPLHNDAVDIVDTLLKHFSADILPTRIILYGDSADTLSQQFITHQWSKSLSFLHVPQISLLQKNFDSKAVIYGAVTQIGFTIEGTSLEKNKDDIKILDPHEQRDKTPVEPEKILPQAEDDLPVTIPDEPMISEEEMPEEKTADVPTEEESAFGFVMDKDISSEPEKETMQEKISDEKPIKSETEDTHYKIHHYADDVIPVDDFESTFKNPSHEIDESSSDEEPRQKEKRPRGNFLPGIIKASVSLLKKPLSILSKVGSMTKTSSKLTLLLPPLLIILLLSLFLFYISNVKALITLGVKPKDINQSQSVTFSLDGSNDFSNNIVSAKAVTASIDGSVSTDATGTKQTGTPAKGSVTLYSRLTSSKTLSSGTVIAGPNNVQFTLDKDVTIASASADASAGPTTASVPVTAKTIGKESNFPSGTKFSFEGLSTDQLVAKNESAFSGGTQKNVTAVAKADIEKLLLDLPKSLEEKAKADISQKAGSGETILTAFTDESVSKKSFDKTVGDEAKTVTLKGTVNFETIAYKNDDVTSFAQSLIKDKYLQDETLSNGSIVITILNAKKENNTKVQATADIKAGLLPKIDIDKIISQLNGKSLTEAKAILSTLPQVNDVVIKLSPNIPFLSRSIPRLKNHITVVVKTHE